MASIKFAILVTFTIIKVSMSGLPENYQTLPGVIKQALLWDQISGTSYPNNNLVSKAPSLQESFHLLTSSYLVNSFTHVSDEIMVGRKRLVHPLGSVAKVTWKIFENSTYTGIFKAGKNLPAFVRGSVGAVDPENFIPGIGVKVFLDGRPSANLFALNNLDGQGMDTNFFAKPYTTTIPDPTKPGLQLLSKTFAAVLPKLPGGPMDRPPSENISPVYEHAEIGETGNVKSPDMITFIPNPAVAWDGSIKVDFRTKLAEIPNGSLLWWIAARPKADSEDAVIGEIRLDSAFVASSYGDETLFFQHPRKAWRA